MARIEINIRFLYEGTLFADTLGYIPRHEAIKVPQLRVQENESKVAQIRNMLKEVKQTQIKPKKAKKQSDYEQDNNDDNQYDQNLDMENEDAQNQIDAQVQQIDEEQQPEMEEQNQIQNLQIQYENDEVEQQDEELDEDNEADDLSQISRSISLNVGSHKNKTKRQKGQLDDFLELPLKKPRKDAKKFDQATQLIRKQQKQRKRRQYIKKLMEAQQKATFQKILNETGRKFRQRQQKQLKQVNEKDHKKYRTLGDVPKIVTKDTIEEGKKIFINKTTLFRIEAFHQPNIRMTESCSICQESIGRYKTKNGERFCSVQCFKRIQQKQNSLKRGA